MEINIRDWTRDDFSQIQNAWLDYCQNVCRADMRLRSDAKSAMRTWLSERFRQPESVGLVADSGPDVVGFLIARIDDWDSVPPVIETRRIGIIDAVFVNDTVRRQGIGSRLIETAIETMRSRKAVAVETVYDAWNDVSVKAWHRAGFAPWMVHAYRML
jgi:GNAT superfamily N-acetyltransferase